MDLVAVPPGRSEMCRIGESDEELYAFFDLEICSVSFDCLNWLLRAEQKRRAEGFRSIHVVLVPGCNDGFGSQHLEPSVKRWRLSTIFFATCGILPTVGKVTVCGSREEAGEIEDNCRQNVFPSGYTTRIYESEDAYESSIAAAKDAWLLGGSVACHVCGNELPILEAPPSSAELVRDWLEPKAKGRKVIVLTLRESGHAKSRNVNREAWLRFAHGLDQSIFFPVVVRDTDQVYQAPQEIPGLTTYLPASLKLDIRMALYESAHLNLLVNNGPVAVCYLNPRIRFIAYRFYLNTDDDGVIPYTEPYGIPSGDQIAFANEFQQIVWDEDRYEVLSETFDAMVQRIDAAEADGSLTHRLRRRAVARDEALRIAMTLHRSDYHLNGAARIYLHLLDENPDDSDARAMLGLLMHHKGNSKIATRLLEHATSRRPDVAVYHFNLGIAYRGMGEHRRSEEAYRHALKLNPKFSTAWANLGELLRMRGEIEGASECYLKALDLGVVDARTIFECASALSDCGRKAKANEIYEKLSGHRFRRQEKRINDTVTGLPHVGSVLRLPSRTYIAPSTDDRCTPREQATR